MRGFMKSDDGYVICWSCGKHESVDKLNKKCTTPGCKGDFVTRESYSNMMSQNATYEEFYGI